MLTFLAATVRVALRAPVRGGFDLLVERAVDFLAPARAVAFLFDLIIRFPLRSLLLAARSSSDANSDAFP